MIIYGIILCVSDGMRHPRDLRVTQMRYTLEFSVATTTIAARSEDYRRQSRRDSAWSGNTVSFV